jgi:predicted transposase/invertase (TIGR01784 family)
LQVLIDSPVAIDQVTFTKNEIPGLTKDSRSGIYDMTCTDENGNTFIVEMQLSEYPEFIQRMKFYALYRLNTLIQKGKYKFKALPKIYCIGILAKNIFPNIADYHNIATLKNGNGELIDDQMTFVTVELAKFKKKLPAVQTDLDKLIYTMKTLHKAKKTIQFPPFWTEEWLETAIRELDTHNMTPEQRLNYEMTLSANAIAVENEREKIEDTRKQEKENFVITLLGQTDFDVSKIAMLTGVSTDFVLSIKQKLQE